MKKNTKKEANVVIDSSIVGVENLEARLNKYDNNVKIITFETKLELIEIFKEVDLENVKIENAKLILEKLEKDSKFKLIKTNGKKGVNPAVLFCLRDFRKNILLTANFKIVKKARVCGVKSIFWKEKGYKGPYEYSKIHTLFDAICKNQKLYIKIGDFNKKKIFVKREGEFIKEENVELNIGDMIYIITKKSSYITVQKYELINLEKEDNIEVKNIKNIYEGFSLKKIRELLS